MSNELDFGDITLIEERVNVRGVIYTLREADEDIACKYRNHPLSATRFRGGQLSGFVGLAEAQALLVSLCLFDEDGKNPKIETVRSWPSRIVKAIFERAKEISELAETEDTIEELEEKLKKAKEVEEAAKNDSEDTENS